MEPSDRFQFLLKGLKDWFIFFKASNFRAHACCQAQGEVCDAILRSWILEWKICCYKSVFIQLPYLCFYYVVQTQMYSMICTHCQRGILSAPTDRLQTSGQCITMVPDLCPSVLIGQFIHNSLSHLWPRLKWCTWCGLAFLEFWRLLKKSPFSAAVHPWLVLLPSLLWYRRPRTTLWQPIWHVNKSVGSDEDHRAESSIWVGWASPMFNKDLIPILWALTSF